MPFAIETHNLTKQYRSQKKNIRQSRCSTSQYSQESYTGLLDQIVLASPPRFVSWPKLYYKLLVRLRLVVMEPPIKPGILADITLLNGR